MPFSGQVVSINIAAGQGEPMQSLDSAAVVAGSGIEGDRYAQGLGKFSAKEGPDRQVTLIESEAVEAVTQETGIELTPEQTRRNIVTRDVPLNHLVGREFSVGDVVLRGLRLNEPCAYLASLTTEGVSRALVHRGGLRAEVVRGGTIRVGDPITPAL
jgi:MOSC domain-containing protein YiiM